MYMAESYFRLDKMQFRHQAMRRMYVVLLSSYLVVLPSNEAVLSSIMCVRTAFLYCHRVRLTSGEDVVLPSLLDLNRAKILYGL